MSATTTSNAAAAPALVPATEAVRAFGVTAVGIDVKEMEIKRRPVQADDVSVRVHYCGVCHTDLHLMRNEWGMTQYPLVPGHEIVGVVDAVGSAVTKWKVGDQVGVGCIVNSCGKCKQCTTDKIEQHCQAEGGFTMTYGWPDKISGGTTHGGYSERIVVPERYILRIPAGLDPAAAAPLLCAGITAYSPLVDAGVKEGSVVGIVGIGGLGHLGIKLAKAMGARVIAFTSKAAKRDELRTLGADDVVVTSDEADTKRVANSLDVVVDSVSADHPVGFLIDALKWGGRYTIIGGPPTVTLPVFPLLMRNIKVSGSGIGGIEQTQAMLDMCAEKKIGAIIETLPLADVCKAIERLEKGDVRYRFVLDVLNHYKA